MWGARGSFLLAAAMVVVVVMPVVFCAKATERQNKNTKISCLLPKSLFITFIVKHIKIHVSLLVVWPKPKLLGGRSPIHFVPTTLVQWTPAYWVSLESSCHCGNNSHIVLRPKHRNIGERDKWLSTSYL